jgi:hypothetical protein
MEQNQLMLFIPSYSLAVLLGVVYIYPIHESPGRPQQFVVNLRRPSSLPWMEIRRKQRSPWAIFLVLTEKCRLDGMRRNQEIRNNCCFSHRFIVVFFFFRILEPSQKCFLNEGHETGTAMWGSANQNLEPTTLGMTDGTV